MEGGFGACRGAEKRHQMLRGGPLAGCGGVFATIRALKMHGEVALGDTRL